MHVSATLASKDSWNLRVHLFLYTCGAQASGSHLKDRLVTGTNE